MTLVVSLKNISAVLLDIEGTTTPISFVYEVLFPFARQHFPEYLDQHFERADVQADLARLREENTYDAKRGHKPPALNFESKPQTIVSVVSYLHWLMDQDRKAT